MIIKAFSRCVQADRLDVGTFFEFNGDFYMKVRNVYKWDKSDGCEYRCNAISLRSATLENVSSNNSVIIRNDIRMRVGSHISFKTVCDIRPGVVTKDYKHQRLMKIIPVEELVSDRSIKTTEYNFVDLITGNLEWVDENRILQCLSVSIV